MTDRLLTAQSFSAIEREGFAEQWQSLVGDDTPIPQRIVKYVALNRSFSADSRLYDNNHIVSRVPDTTPGELWIIHRCWMVGELKETGVNTSNMTSATFNVSPGTGNYASVGVTIATLQTFPSGGSAGALAGQVIREGVFHPVNTGDIVWSRPTRTGTGRDYETTGFTIGFDLFSLKLGNS